MASVDMGGANQTPLAHPEEMSAQFELTMGDRFSVSARARATPAGLICAGLGLAALTLALAYLARSRRAWR